ncbi:hypothetical protein SynMVIR181_02944 [Synechococcus sp. MVIR-18-1]|nr:hypothetical protein SynMVIR181_02944 [Synechococcus sp. MVIR-18-1]
MTAPYDDHVEDFGGGSADDHQFIIPIIWWDSEWLKSLPAQLMTDFAQLTLNLNALWSLEESVLVKDSVSR